MINGRKFSDRGGDGDRTGNGKTVTGTKRYRICLMTSFILPHRFYIYTLSHYRECVVREYSSRLVAKDAASCSRMMKAVDIISTRYRAWASTMHMRNGVDLGLALLT